MFKFARLSLGLVARCIRSRRRLLLENLGLRQQLAVLKRRQARAELSALQALFGSFWCWRAGFPPTGESPSETVVRWHRAGFRLYWRLISQVKKQVGRKNFRRKFES